MLKSLETNPFDNSQCTFANYGTEPLVMEEPKGIYDEIPLDTEEQVRKFIKKEDESGIFRAKEIAKWLRVPAASLGIDRKNQLKTFPMEHWESGIVKSIDWSGRLCCVAAKGTDSKRIPLDIITFDPKGGVYSYSCYFYPGENKKKLSTEWGEWLCDHVGIDNLHKMPQVLATFFIKDKNETNRNGSLFHYLNEHSACKGIDKSGCRYIAIKIQHFDMQGKECYKCIELIHENSQESNSYSSIPITWGKVKVTRSIFKSKEDFSSLKNLLNGEKIKTSQMNSGYVKIY